MIKHIFWGLAMLALALAPGARAAEPPVSADVFVSPGGDDVAGEGSFDKPYATVDRARAALRTKLTGAGQSRDWTVLFRGGTYFLPETVTFTPDDGAGAGHVVTYAAYPGETVVWSGGTDITELLHPADLPALGLSNVCQAEIPGPRPFTQVNANYYFGEIWVNGVRASEPIRPRRGSDWFHMREGGSAVPTTQIATFTEGSKTIRLTSAAALPGGVGSAIAFNKAGFGFRANRSYWILSMSDNDVELGASPGGAALLAQASGALPLQDNVQAVNAADRVSTAVRPSLNRFGFNAGADPELSSSWTNVTDIKIQIPTGGASSDIIPVQSIDDKGQTVTLNSHVMIPAKLYPGHAWRRWNRFEDIGPGEMYLNRQTGVLTYVPRPGETCSNIKVIAPRLLQLMLISNSRAAGGPTGVPAGNIAFSGITFSHTQSTLYSGAFDLAGNTGGIMGVESNHANTLSSGIVTVGAENVLFDHDAFTHFGESGILTSFGSNHVTIRNSSFSDLGGAPIIAGGYMADRVANYKYSSRTAYTGFNFDGPTTPDSPFDASNCCLSVINSTMDDFGLLSTGVAGIAITHAQSFTISHNTIRNSPSFGIAVGSDWDHALPANRNSLYSIGSFGTTIAYNDISNCGYEKNPAGVPVPGGSMVNDFGCLYVRGPQDGDGAKPRMSIIGNNVHDVSSGAWLTFDGKTPTRRAHGFDGVLDYHDGNDASGIDESNNLFYNLNSLDPVHPGYPNRLMQHTGNMRDDYWNNIYYGFVPAGFKYPKDFAAQAFYGAGDPNSPWAIPIEGPQPFLRFTRNIIVIDQPGGPAAPFQHNLDVRNRNQFYKNDYNMYFERGKTIVDYVDYGGKMSIDEWRSPPFSQDVHSLFDVDPNFKDPAHGDFTFKSTGEGAPCAGTGGVSPACGFAEPFIPWDYTAAGAH
ncbi:right-handed parallel beta-helix repeat-containing protein [Methylocella tundrae]|uniref:Uncharacterized protein n=1 Tax=Methylocella tundrae TaxID=227605 RepID=A0A4U8Z0W7_METTU|nr:right-handed parallel beta-helix repeat-containing protein [Methylocella tundrae]WPP06249.1 right-handed parallel beta-helix repeat-containing protein [Methylocella tundrae]VFU08921.1 exported protein of unknown function [Methylocella tundrae]